MALACAAISAAGTALVPSAGAESPSIYFGALVDGRAPTAAAFQPGGAFHEFERMAGKKLALVHFGQPWKMRGQMQEFPRPLLQSVRDHGSIPVLNWGSHELGAGLDQPDLQLRDVYGGAYDAYIARWAAGARAWGHPFMIRFNHEMNGWWFPWGEGETGSGHIINGNGRGDYVKAWRHVHDIFERVGASNVTWLWAPNISTNDRRYPSLDSLFPGQRYVDWVGLSAYNKNPRNWQSFSTLLTGTGTNYVRNSYAMLAALAPSKPIMIAETASVEAGDGGARKAAWITDMLQRLPTAFPRIRGIMWFDWSVPGYETVPIDTSPAALTAFAQGVQSPAFATNRYGSVSQSPIPPPSAAPPAHRRGSKRTRSARRLVLRARQRGARMRFDLSSLAGRRVRSVTLRVRTAAAPGAGSRRPLAVQVARGSARLGTLRARRPARWYSARLDTAAVRARRGRSLSLRLRSRGGDRLVLASRAGRFAPRLVVKI